MNLRPGMASALFLRVVTSLEASLRDRGGIRRGWWRRWAASTLGPGDAGGVVPDPSRVRRRAHARASMAAEAVRSFRFPRPSIGRRLERLTSPSTSDSACPTASKLTLEVLAEPGRPAGPGSPRAPTRPSLRHRAGRWGSIDSGTGSGSTGTRVEERVEVDERPVAADPAQASPRRPTIRPLPGRFTGSGTSNCPGEPRPCRVDQVASPPPRSRSSRGKPILHGREITV